MADGPGQAVQNGLGVLMGMGMPVSMGVTVLMTMLMAVLMCVRFQMAVFPICVRMLIDGAVRRYMCMGMYLFLHDHRSLSWVLSSIAHAYSKYNPG